MIDIHSHALPSVDDGSIDLSNSLDIIKNSIEDGVKDMILTPHFRGNYTLGKEELSLAFDNFSSEVKKSGLDINLYLGQEIFYSKENKELFSAHSVLTLNGSRYVLVEFDFAKESDIGNVIYDIKTMGYKPIVAHIERYSYADIETAFDVKSVGGFIQVNAGSIIAPACSKQKKFIKQMFKEGLVDFVASDAHSFRKPCMASAYKWVSKKFGLDTADKVFNLNAQDILEG